MEDIRNKGNSKLKPLIKKPIQQDNKQLLDFDEVNYEQMREPYRERMQTDYKRSPQVQLTGRP